jgi:hypothetical protein
LRNKQKTKKATKRRFTAADSKNHARRDAKVEGERPEINNRVVEPVLSEARP